MRTHSPDELRYGSSGKDLIDEGLSENPELRLFETGWSGGTTVVRRIKDRVERW